MSLELPLARCAHCGLRMTLVLGQWVVASRVVGPALCVRGLEHQFVGMALPQG